MKNLQEYILESFEGSFDISYILPTVQAKLDEYIKYIGRKYPELKNLHTEPLEPELKKSVDKHTRGQHIGKPIDLPMWLKTDVMRDDVPEKATHEESMIFNEKIDVGTLKLSFKLDVPSKWDGTNIVEIRTYLEYKPNAKGKKIGLQQGTGMYDFLDREITVGAHALCTNTKYGGSLMVGVVKSIGPEKITIDIKGEKVIVYPGQCAVLTPDMLK